MNYRFPPKSIQRFRTDITIGVSIHIFLFIYFDYFSINYLRYGFTYNVEEKPIGGNVTPLFRME